MLINRRQPVIKLGLSPELADILARQTVIGAGAMLESLPEDALDLRQNVISPGGTTKAALKVLMRKNGMQSLLDEAVTAAHARARPRSG
ncbi:pyrroline-5-carboxylate reductase family protein [Rhizobium leguminosarum]|nr:pyrroline-5-carboxylate reductase dimerization domain-containing protein [Rhizobium leguminosarum]